MAATAFDTLAAARRLKAAGIKAEHAEAIAEVVGLAVNQPKLVTVEHFDAEIANLRMEIMRTHLVSVGVIVAALALATTILGIIITQGGGV